MTKAVKQLLKELTCIEPEEVADYQDEVLDLTEKEEEPIKLQGIKIA